MNEAREQELIKAKHTEQLVRKADSDCRVFLHGLLEFIPLLLNDVVKDKALGCLCHGVGRKALKT